MKAVMKDDGTISHNQHTILDEQVKFYKALYQRDSDINFALTPEHDERRLSCDQREMLEADFTMDEFFDAIMTLKSNKVPGLDGLTIEVYRKFWKDLGPYLIEMYQYSFDNNLLPRSVREGLISLLPKKNKDIRLVKNMRPLTLLNNDYKILTKALDNRLRSVLPDIIQGDQTGFVKGRKISHNIRKSLDVIDYAKTNNIAGVILSIDMEKCFDRLEHSAILGSLKYFNFGKVFIKWVSILYKEFYICTQNFGILSSFWLKGRGTNQGGSPQSWALFALSRNYGEQVTSE